MRGAWFSAFATLLAAASHMLVGGNTPAPVALVATAIVVLPLCVALAGRERSLWRTSLAVALSQGLFHWSFGAIGAVTAQGSVVSGSGFAAAASPHADHLGSLGQFVPMLDSPGAGWLMLAAHAVAALVTVAMLRFGENALLRIREALASLGAQLVGKLPALSVALPRGGRVSTFGYAPARPLATSRASISHRGPPGWVSFSV